MKKYEKALVALELNSECDHRLLERAQQVAEGGTALSILHAVEHFSSYGAAYGVAVGAEFEQSLMGNAKASLNEVGQQLNLSESHLLLKVGPAKHLILEEAEKMGADLIIIGSHGRHGIRLLLGSTANAVLHGAKCDVLAVRLEE